jgi:transcriptional regulator with XRE-family HTH domain
MLNERIRQLRLAKGLTLQQVGNTFGISRSSVAAWESGISKPDTSKLVKLAEVLDSTVEYLLDSPESLSFTDSLMLQSSEVDNSIPFVRWELISKDIFARNPDQFITALNCTPGIGAFATRLAASGDWDWRPALIPAGALMIINPHDELCPLDFVIASYLNDPIQLMQVSSDASSLINVSKINTNSIEINSKHLTLYGKVIEWSLRG